MTNRALYFRHWLTKQGACLAGRRFAGARDPLEVMLDPTIRTDYISWYLEHLLKNEQQAIPVGLYKGPIDGIAFEDLSPRAKWRLISLRLRHAQFTANPRNVFFIKAAGVYEPSPFLAAYAYVPLPRITAPARGTGGYFLAGGEFQSQWVRRIV